MVVMTMAMVMAMPVVVVPIGLTPAGDEHFCHAHCAPLPSNQSRRCAVPNCLSLRVTWRFRGASSGVWFVSTVTAEGVCATVTVGVVATRHAGRDESIMMRMRRSWSNHVNSNRTPKMISMGPLSD